MIRLFDFVFGSAWGKALAAASGLALLIVAYTREQRSIGAERATRKIEKASDAAATLGSGAADKSRASGMQPGRSFRGRVDPTTRYD